jgi:hypothetical protein
VKVKRLSEQIGLIVDIEAALIKQNSVGKSFQKIMEVFKQKPPAQTTEFT